MIREINVEDVKNIVATLCIQANYELSSDMCSKLREAKETENLQ